MSTKTVRSGTWAKRIADSRGKKWHANMLEGRRQAILNPSVLRLLRSEKRIQQSDLARKVKLSVSTYGAVERGKRFVKADVAKLIADALKVQLQKIFQTKGKKFVAIIRKATV